MNINIVPKNINVVSNWKFNILGHKWNIAEHIPSKFDVYCHFIPNADCTKNDYYKKIISNDLFKNIQIIDSTPFLIEKASEELQKNNFLYYFDDTHLNSLGSAYLSKFLVEKLKVEKILN